jgi:ATP-dependent RNA helicase DHX36
LFDNAFAFVEHIYFFHPQELRKELDILLQEKIESPHPVDWNDTKSRDCAVLSAILDLIKTQEKATPRNFPPRFQDGYYS